MSKATDRPLGLARIAELRSPIEALCRRFGVRKLGLFGSSLEGGSGTAVSDIDLTVEFESVDELSPARQYFDFKTELERMFGRAVDLMELEAMQDSRLKRIIQRTQVLVYAQAV